MLLVTEAFEFHHGLKPTTTLKAGTEDYLARLDKMWSLT